MGWGVDWRGYSVVRYGCGKASRLGWGWGKGRRGWGGCIAAMSGRAYARIAKSRARSMHGGMQEAQTRTSSSTIRIQGLTHAGARCERIVGKRRHCNAQPLRPALSHWRRTQPCVQLDCTMHEEAVKCCCRSTRYGSSASTWPRSANHNGSAVGLDRSLSRRAGRDASH